MDLLGIVVVAPTGCYHGWSTYPPAQNKGFIASLIKENQWVFRSPAHKALSISGREATWLYVGGVD